MKSFRHVPTQIITHHSIKLNKVAVENNWNPDEIKWKGTNTTKVKAHITNQSGSQENQVHTQTIRMLSFIFLKIC